MYGLIRSIADIAPFLLINLLDNESYSQNFVKHLKLLYTKGELNYYLRVSTNISIECNFFSFNKSTVYYVDAKWVNESIEASQLASFPFLL